MPLSTINHKGRRILLVDFSTCRKEAEMLETLKATEQFYKSNPGKILSLTDATNAFASPKFMEESKRLNKEIYSKQMEKGAIIGVSGVKKILLKGYNMFSATKIVPFETKEAALDFLAS